MSSSLITSWQIEGNDHDGMITHLGPDILECEAKWALGTTIMNKASEVVEFQLSYYKS